MVFCADLTNGSLPGTSAWWSVLQKDSAVDSVKRPIVMLLSNKS